PPHPPWPSTSPSRIAPEIHHNSPGHDPKPPHSPRPYLGRPYLSVALSFSGRSTSRQRQAATGSPSRGFSSIPHHRRQGRPRATHPRTMAGLPTLDPSISHRAALFYRVELLQKLLTSPWARRTEPMPPPPRLSGPWTRTTRPDSARTHAAQDERATR